MTDQQEGKKIETVVDATLRIAQETRQYAAQARHALCTLFAGRRIVHLGQGASTETIYVYDHLAHGITDAAARGDDTLDSYFTLDGQVEDDLARRICREAVVCATGLIQKDGFRVTCARTENSKEMRVYIWLEPRSERKM